MQKLPIPAMMIHVSISKEKVEMVYYAEEMHGDGISVLTDEAIINTEHRRVAALLAATKAFNLIIIPQTVLFGIDGEEGFSMKYGEFLEKAQAFVRFAKSKEKKSTTSKMKVDWS